MTKHGVFNVRLYGALGDGTTDDSDAFERAIDAMGTAIWPGNVGLTLLVPPGTYRLSRPLLISHSMVLEGGGGEAATTGSKLWFDPGSDGVVVQRYDSTTNGGEGAGSVIRNLHIGAAGKTTLACGIRLNAAARLQNLYVGGFATDGIHIVADHNSGGALVGGDPEYTSPWAATTAYRAGTYVTNGGNLYVCRRAGTSGATGPSGTPAWPALISDGTVEWGYVVNGTNANLWMIDFCRSAGNGRHGLYVAGIDANAGVAINLDCSLNGGWGILDESFLGCTYLQCHTSGNTMGAYKAVGAVSQCLFLGCYSESGQPDSEIGYPSMVLGGTHGTAVTGSGPRLIAGVLSNVFSLGRAPGSPPFDARFGEYGGTGVVFAMNDGNAPYPATQLRYRPPTDPYTPSTVTWNLANISGYDAQGIALNGAVFRSPIGATRDRGLEAGQLFTTDFGGTHRSYGITNQGVRIAHGTAPPVGGNWIQGDCVFNQAAAAGQPMGWMCTVSGTAGTYSEAITATANGTTTITLSAASSIAFEGLRVGDRVLVGGVSTYIVDFNAARTTVTLGASIPAGSGLSIAFVPPTFLPMPNL